MSDIMRSLGGNQLPMWSNSPNARLARREIERITLNSIVTAAAIQQDANLVRIGMNEAARLLVEAEGHATRNPNGAALFGRMLTAFGERTMSRLDQGL